MPRNERDYDAIVRGTAPAGFALAGRVFVDGRPMLALFTREPPQGGAHVYRAEQFGAQFDREFASPWAPVGYLYRSAEHAPECGPGGPPSDPEFDP